MKVLKKCAPLGILLVAVLIGVSDCVRVRTRFIRYTRYTSGYYGSSNSESSLSAGVIAAIVIGSIAGPIIFTVCIIWCVVCCKKSEQRNAQAGRIITRSPQVISTIQAATTHNQNMKYSQANGQHFTNGSFSIEPPKYNDLVHTNTK